LYVSPKSIKPSILRKREEEKLCLKKQFKEAIQLKETFLFIDETIFLARDSRK
jgi:hypothetical protein